MKLLTAKEIKKIIIGVMLTDGYIDMNKFRFDFYSKDEEYAKYIFNVLQQISGMESKFYIKRDKRGYVGYRVFTKKHAYWKNLGSKFYDGRKEMNQYIIDRVNEQSLAHMWMCDGYLEHSKNRKLEKVQNIGWFCLEAFPDYELKLFQNKLLKYGIDSTLTKKPWGFGYRIRLGGENIQKLISLIYPYILNCFEYKTPIFYKSKGTANMSLPSAEHFIKEYDKVDDIVRYLAKVKKT